jgi:hypothetical protein
MVSELDCVLVETLNDIGVIHYTVNLLLVFSFIDLSLLPFIEFDKYTNWFTLVRHLICTLHHAGEALKITTLNPRL